MFEKTSSDNDGTFFSGGKKQTHGSIIFPEAVWCTGLLQMQARRYCKYKHCDNLWDQWESSHQLDLLWWTSWAQRRLCDNDHFPFLYNVQSVKAALNNGIRCKGLLSLLGSISLSLELSHYQYNYLIISIIISLSVELSHYQ